MSRSANVYVCSIFNALFQCFIGARVSTFQALVIYDTYLFGRTWAKLASVLEPCALFPSWSWSFFEEWQGFSRLGPKQFFMAILMPLNAYQNKMIDIIILTQIWDHTLTMWLVNSSVSILFFVFVLFLFICLKHESNTAEFSIFFGRHDQSEIAQTCYFRDTLKY